MNTLGDRIKYIRGGVSQEVFAGGLGISKGALGFYERNENQPNAAFIVELCSQYKILPEWLLFGTGPVKPGVYAVEHHVAPVELQSPNLSPEIISCTNGEMVLIPLVEARLSAGGGSFETSGDIIGCHAFRAEFLRRKGQLSQMVLMRVSGDSMEPEFRDGDVVLIDQSQHKPRPGGVYAVAVDDMVYLKIVDASPGRLVLSSYNKSYSSLEVDTRGDLIDTVRIIGHVIWLGRDFS